MTITVQLIPLISLILIIIIERMHKLKTLNNFVFYFPFAVFKREIMTWIFTEQRSPFYFKGRDGFL